MVLRAGGEVAATARIGITVESAVTQLAVPVSFPTVSKPCRVNAAAMRSSRRKRLKAKFAANRFRDGAYHSVPCAELAVLITAPAERDAIRVNTAGVEESRADLTKDVAPTHGDRDPCLASSWPPIPSCPCVFEPQQKASPTLFNAQV